MTVERVRGTRDRFATRLQRLPVPRLLALAGTLALLSSFLTVLYGVVDTVGDPVLFYPVVVLSLVAATVVARFVRVFVAIGIGAVMLVGGMYLHLRLLSADLSFLVVLSHNVELLTGHTVLGIQQADVWAMAVTPMPVFVTWYLALRRWYVSAAVVGGSMLCYLVSTGDAGMTVTLVGVVGAAATIAFGDIEATGWSGAADQATVVLALMVVTPLVITVVPGGAASPVAFIDDETGTMEDNVVTADESLEIVGSIEQNPEPRFTVTAEEPRLWRTKSFDRYTGSGWVSTSGSTAYVDADVDEQPGTTRQLRQEVEVQSSIELVPAAWQPMTVDDDIAGDVHVSDDGAFTIDGSLHSGEEYTVTSSVPDPNSEELTEAGRNYPTDVFETYTQLPASTPDRVGDRTEHITQNADNPYETALVVEDWLITNRGYSLEIDRPQGDIADAFLFEMEAGYCTYFATTMVTMLRSQDIPARMAVGYSTGDRISEDTYLARGLNSHAWVEVYFPDVGWVEFDPTPATPRQQTEREAIEGDDFAGEEYGEPGPTIDDVDDPEEDDPTDVPEFGDADSPNDVLEPDELEDRIIRDDGTGAGNGVDEGDDGFAIPLPSRERTALGSVLLVGLIAWARQSGVARQLSRAFTIRFQRRADPATDTERAYERLMLILETRYRSRKTGETVRQYLDGIDADDRARRVVELRERGRYGDDVTRADADEAVELVDSIRQNVSK